MTCSIVQADALDFLRQLPEGSVDLVFGSPPYEEARLYLEDGVNLGVSRKTEAWVPWMADIHEAAQRACRGLVAFVVAGQTRKFRWSAGPVLYAAELHRRGLNLRNPPIFHRVGIPGSGGPDWLRSDYEWIVCTTPPGKLPWSDNTAMGHAPKWAPGGEMSHRLSDGTRVNQWGRVGSANSRGEKPTCSRGTRRPSHKMTSKREQAVGDEQDDSRNLLPGQKARVRSGTRNKQPRQSEGDGEQQAYDPPAIANPGNVIKLNVGGGLMGGDEYSSQNEAPFPEALAEFFVRSFCPPGGMVVDCFSGSGTTAAVSVRNSRNFTGCDLRASQVKLAIRRVSNETPLDLLSG